MGLTTFLPDVVEILFISILLSYLTTLAYKYLSNQAVMKEIKEELDRLKTKMKDNKRDPEKLAEIQKQMMPLNMKFFKLSMKPTLITLLPMLLIFVGLSYIYGDTIIIHFPFSLPLIGNSLGWIGTYIIFSLIFTTLIRKAMKVA